MCGIFGYIGHKNPLRVCLDGLKLLEYRGYDSSGIAGVQQQQLHFWKEKGKIHHLEQALSTSFMELENAISHTRWATHGESSLQNAHPQLDDLKHIAVVHNGIITNYSTLKQMLQEQGKCFHSDTDSEVIAQLVSYYYQGDLLIAFQKALSQLQGFWAIALIHKDHAKQILVAAKENPVVIAMNQQRTEAFISSDVHALQDSDLDIFFLKDHEIASVSSNDLQIFNALLQHVHRESKQLTLQSQEISKNGFPHFMLKEIFEQPDVIRQTLHGRYEETWGTALFPELSTLGPTLHMIDQVLIIACGT